MTMMTPPPLDQEDEEMLVPHSDLVEGPQPMEVVAQVEPATTVENQPIEDPPSMKFTWTIENFSRLNTKKHYSDVFVVGGYKWRILIFPKGNNVDHLSMYLDVADSATLPYGWSRYAQFSLAVVNQIHNKYSIRKDTQHQFNARESDWGFTSFMPLSDLYDPSRGYLVNDTVVIEAEVAVRKVLDYWSYDSKKETGYVGLKNQGATCYMNSLLQTLYHIPYFRKAVYHMPTTENDMPTGSIPLALQSLFYKLQYNDTSVATKELTKSFGWDTYDSFMQHDVQELNRVLCEKLEDKMKGTVVEGTIQQLFEGHHMNYIECINVDYKSTRKESYYDLQLDVKGCRDVYASFDKYVEVERLEGDNKYHAEEHGLQDAKKGVLFIDFPPVLQLQLKRFEYDFMRDTMVKINDRYEFPLQLDLDRENGKYLSPEADRSVRNLYTLHSVLVHSGGVHGGHYYAFIRPTLSDQWFKFDDERVTKEDMKRALEEQYGGEEELPQTNPGFNNAPFKFTKYSNAYMLVYIRESDKDKIICNVDEKDIAEHLRIRLKKEQEEKEDKRRYKAQAHLYTIIKVARDEDLKEQIGRDIYFDLVDHDKVRNFRVLKQTPFSVFKEEVAKEFGIPVQFQRFWMWAKRQNDTYRPHRPLTSQEEAQSVGQLREVSNKADNAELKLFLEVELGLDLRPIAPPYKTKEDILLFFKHYDPQKGELRYVGRLFVKSSGKPIEILAKLNQMAGFAPDDEIELYEEIMFEPCVMCDHLYKSISFRLSQIQDGDIICFQKSPPFEGEEDCRYPDVPSFLEYVHNRKLSRRGRSPSRSSSIEVVDPEALRARRGRDQAEEVAGANEVVQSGTTQQQEQGGLAGEAARTEAPQVHGQEASAKGNEDFTFSVDELVGRTEDPNSASVRDTLSILPEVDLTVEDYLSDLSKETPFVPSTTISMEEHPIISPSIDPLAPSSSSPHEVITEADDEEVTPPVKRQRMEETTPEGEQILQPSKVPSISASELVGGTPLNEMQLMEVDEATIPGPVFPKQALVSVRKALDESVRALDQYRVEVRETLLAQQEVISKQDAEIQQLKDSLEREKKNQALLHELKNLRSEVDRLESEKAEFQTQSWEWEGRFKRKNEDFEKLTQESQTQIASLQNTVRARDDEIQGQRKTIQDLEEDKRQMGIQVVELQEKVKDLPEIREALSDPEKARNQLRDAQDKVKVAEFHRKRAENDRKIAISRFLQSDSYKQRLLADGMRRAVQYYNKALDDAAVKFPRVLANVPKRRLPKLPAPPDEFEFVVTREEERESRGS